MAPNLSIIIPTYNEEPGIKQALEGLLSHPRLADRDNQPRYASMRWYADTIGFSLNEAIHAINSMPKLYSLK